MLKAHMDAIEDTLVAQSLVSANSGHSLHKGTPREAFIKDFLQDHLPESVAIGTGEIIDAHSQPNSSRNQFDIVIYKKNYPKLKFGGDISAFLVESVIATIEVKSVLDKDALKQAITAARNAKQLTPNFLVRYRTGYIPPKVLNYIVAYDGPANMTTVHNWIPQVYLSNGIPNSDLPPTQEDRIKVSSESIDGVFVLKKGWLQFDNSPWTFQLENLRAEEPTMKWLFLNQESGNLLHLFLMLQSASSNSEGRLLNPTPYLSSYTFPGVHWGG